MDDTPSTHTLVPFTGDRLHQARTYATLTDEDLRRVAVRAARDKDLDALWSLTLAYLTSDTVTGVNTSPHTLRSYRTSVARFLDHATNDAWNILQPSKRAPAMYVAHLAASGLKPATVNARIAGASALYRALRWAGATEADPFGDVSRPRDRTRSIVKNPPYRPDFVEQMADACDPQTLVLFLLMAHGGLRVAEALNVRWEDISLERRRLLVEFGKGNKSRLVPLSRRLREAIAVLRTERGLPSHGRVFTFRAYSTAYERLRKVAVTVGRDVEFRGFHAGRKYAGTQLYAQVRDFTRVAGFLGHEQVDTTRRYVELPEDDLDDVVENFR